jgi:hypothetical protein
MVTVACILEPGVADQLNAWLSTIYNMITEKRVHLPETSHLFLEIHKGSGSCNYYFVDNAIRTVFWLHTIDPVTLRPQRSSSHLRMCHMSIHLVKQAKCSFIEHALEENYWIHVELFPETASQYSVQALNELQDVLLNAGAGAQRICCLPTYPA